MSYVRKKIGDRRFEQQLANATPILHPQTAAHRVALYEAALREMEQHRDDLIVACATTGYRGQHLLCKLRDALDAMPVKRLITDAIKDNNTGEVCALGALDPAAPAYDEDDDWQYAEKLARHFGIATALAAEIVYMNDEAAIWRSETPEERWVRIRAWVQEQIRPETDEPPSRFVAVDPVGGRG